MKGRPRNEAAYAHFLELADTHGTREIAEITGMSSRQITRWRKISGKSAFSHNPAGKHWGEEEFAAVRAMVDDGASTEEIARTLHVSRGSVRRHFPDAPWSLEMRVEYMAIRREAARNGF